MDIKTFMVGSTNIFPLANSTRSGQLLTEWNLRSRESVASDSNVEYHIGLSFVHGEKDYEVSRLTDSADGTTISSSTLQIAPGRAVINGHYVESLVPMTIDLTDVNTEIKKRYGKDKNVLATNDLEGKENENKELVGKLKVGFRVMYSSLPTMAGAMLAEDENDYYEGIQTVILPAEHFKLPRDVPNDPGAVTAHICLATFYFINGAIVNIENNFPEKCQYIESKRILTIDDDGLQSVFVRKNKLNPKKLYTFSGKGTDPEKGKDTWCDSTDSLIVWDQTPTLGPTRPINREANFIYDAKGVTQLYLPHKQVDAWMNDSNSEKQYYQPRIVDLPLADFTKNTPGTVNKAYTKKIKQIQEKLNEFYRLPNSEFLRYISVRGVDDPLPEINTNWETGSYIVYGIDETLDILEDSTRAPATMYVVLPGIVKSILYIGNTRPSGFEIDRLEWYEGVNVLPKFDTTVNSDSFKNYNSLWNFDDNTYRGDPTSNDYFSIVYTDNNDNKSYFYFKPYITGPREFSEPMWLTGEIGLASEEAIGGFLNVPNEALGNGYVQRDSEGFLRLLDYDLLATGVLAYQLGQDREFDDNLTADAIQEELDQFVCQRVAFPNEYQLKNATNPNVINITLNLPSEDEQTIFTIEDIDCRFNTTLYLHIFGEANSNTIINISDCQKIRIDSNIQGNPQINLARCNLYYDPYVMDHINIIDGLSLWYERFEETDPNLYVDGMTVRETDTPIMADDLEFWTDKEVNDNHFMYALHSLTFDRYGTIIGCELKVKNETTANISCDSQAIVSEFTLPTGVGLSYPKSSLRKRLKVTGSFVTAYPLQSPRAWKMIDTNFTALTNTCGKYDDGKDVKGVISFYTKTEELANVLISDNLDKDSIDGWDSNSFHIFSGGVLS